MNIIFLGPPGAGKGTHAQMLIRELSIPQISTGDILRAAIKEKTKVGLEAKHFIDEGKLVPDEVVIEIVRERLQEKDCARGYILDGFPRTVLQAEELDKFAHIDVAVNLSLADEVIVNRLSGRRVCPACGGTYHTSTLNGKTVCEKCGGTLIQRKDDSAETVQNRLKVYAEQTAPLIDYYRKKGILRTVECVDDINANHQAVLEALQGDK
jgi:adenylate kinase